MYSNILASSVWHTKNFTQLRFKDAPIPGMLPGRIVLMTDRQTMAWGRKAVGATNRRSATAVQSRTLRKLLPSAQNINVMVHVRLLKQINPGYILIWGNTEIVWEYSPITAACKLETNLEQNSQNWLQIAVATQTTMLWRWRRRPCNKQPSQILPIHVPSISTECAKPTHNKSQQLKDNT